jgi:hypothetical protein
MSFNIHNCGLKKHSLQLQPMFELKGEWHIDDITDAYENSPYEPPQVITSLLHRLNNAEAIEATERNVLIRSGPEQSSVSLWTWNEEAKQKLREHAENVNTLPCGCRSHVPDMRDGPEGKESVKSAVKHIQNKSSKTHYERENTHGRAIQSLREQRTTRSVSDSQIKSAVQENERKRV